MNVSSERFEHQERRVLSIRAPSVRPNRAVVPLSGWIATVLLALLGLRSANPVLTAFAIGCIPCILQLVWRHGEPPVLVFACCMQWLQASAAIFYTDYYGISLNESFGRPELELAT